MIPSLDLEQSAGVGKLNRAIKVRQTSGTEAGSLLGDVQLVHVLESADQVATAETYLPGAGEAYERAFGEDSDGKRPLEWRPSHGGVSLSLVLAPKGRALYEGPATVLRAVLRVLPRACVLTVYVRLDALRPEHLGELSRAMGELVEYELVASTLAGASGDQGVDGGLPFGQRVEFAPGDIVTLPAEHGQPGIVVSLAGGRAIVRQALVDDPSVLPIDVPAGAVLSSMRVCGPKGGPPGDALERLARTAPSCRPGDLLLAILQAQGEGQTELLPQGWTLTSSVLATAAALTDDPAPPVNDGNLPGDPEGDELPPEPA